MTFAITPQGPNAEQIEYWNSEPARKWIAFEDRLDAFIEPFGMLAIERAALAAGERVLDVGCGCGATCLALAARVGQTGHVLGVDVSSLMLARAQQRARDAGLRNVEFANADAQTHRFEPGARDLVFSRFGVMFFADPERAFSNLREALRPGGRASFVCWRPLVDNPWFAEPLRALVTVVTPPPPPPPGAPGPFSLGDPDRVRGILGAAGFDRIDIAPHDRELRVGADLDEAVSFSLSMGPASRLLAGADAAQRARAEEVVRAALAPYAGGGGVVLTGAIWLVAARNPA